MAKRLHERIIDSIKAGEIAFNLDTFESHLYCGYPDFAQHTLPEVPLAPVCGTVCCIAGHLAHLLPEEERGPVGFYDVLAIQLWDKEYPHANMSVFSEGISYPGSWPRRKPSLLQVEHFLKYCTGLYDEKGWRLKVPAERVRANQLSYAAVRMRIDLICLFAEETSREATT